jgi:IS605 OrfB family transposase
MRQLAVHFIAWCVEQRIDTIVLGVNHDWKQEVRLGKKNTQNFVQIPFAFLRGIIKYLAQEKGILCVEQEESYTSKASFIDDDFIPVYKKGDDTKYRFSGRRRPTEYKGTKKKDGFRGLYKTKDGTIINSDLNGSANILRKAYPDAFKNTGVRPDFNNVLIIKNPRQEFIDLNRFFQEQEREGIIMSKSRTKRLMNKLA